MKPENWERLEDLFEQAVGLSGAEQKEFLGRVLRDNEELGRQLSDLVRAHEATQSMETPWIDLHQLWPPAERMFQDNQLLLDRFRIVRFLGKGGMGEVYEAEDRHLGRVALKTLRPEVAADPRFLRRFAQEVQLARKVTSVHVCRIHELFTIPAAGAGPAASFLTMEFLEGTTLAQRTEAQGPLPLEEAASVALQLCSALRAIHDAGIIHRDFKSQNVMLVPRSGGPHAVVMDLGLARDAAPDSGAMPGLTVPGAVMGTPEYMAPEQFRGQAVTPATDVYALGVVLYEIATGHRPFHAATPLEAAILRAKSPPAASSIRPEVPPHWDQVIARCLRYEAAERFQSAAEVAAALERPGRSARAAWRAAPRPAAGLALAAALGFGAWTVRSRLVPSAPPQERVAVLEFENIGGDPANQAFCEGLMESLTGKLTELEPFQGTLSVVPASDVRREKVASARDARRGFGVNLVITGSVQRSPSGVRLIVNLVDARQLKQLRSREFFAPASDAVSMQQGVVTGITALLHLQLAPESERRLAAGNTTAPGAYEFYLQGSGYLLSGRPGTDQAITEFQHALEHDPNYALAYAGLCSAYLGKYLDTNDRHWIDEASPECDLAIHFGEKLAEPHIALAAFESGNGRLQDAIKEAREAIRLDASNDRAYIELARALDAAGQAESAEATLQKAAALGPGHWYNYVRLGSFYGNHGRYKEAETPFRRAIELQPDNPAGYTNLGGIYHYEGRETEAEEMLKTSIRVRPTKKAYDNLATVYFFERRYAEAVPIMEQVVADSKDYVKWGNLGDAYRWTPSDRCGLLHRRTRPTLVSIGPDPIERRCAELA